MGIEWDPDGDAERRKEGRARLWLTITIVAAPGAFAVKQVYQWRQAKQREAIMRELSQPRAY